MNSLRIDPGLREQYCLNVINTSMTVSLFVLRLSGAVEQRFLFMCGAAEAPLEGSKYEH